MGGHFRRKRSAFVRERDGTRRWEKALTSPYFSYAHSRLYVYIYTHRRLIRTTVLDLIAIHWQTRYIYITYILLHSFVVPIAVKLSNNILGRVNPLWNSNVLTVYVGINWFPLIQLHIIIPLRDLTHDNRVLLTAVGRKVFQIEIF